MKISKYIKKKKKDKIKTPQIVISQDAMAKLAQYTTAKSIEITLFGIVEKKEDEVYYISDFVIPPQDSNSAAFVTTNDEAYSKWLNEMDRETRQKLRLHYHTHPNMGVTPSGTDQSTIREKVENISNFYIRIIGNKDLKFHIDLFDLENEMLYEEMSMYMRISDDYIIQYNKTGATIIYPSNENAEKELDEKIIKKTTFPKVSRGIYGDYYDDYYGGYYGRSTKKVNHTNTNKNPYDYRKDIQKTNKTTKVNDKKKAREEKYEDLLSQLDESMMTGHVTEELQEALEYSKHEDMMKVFQISKEEWDDMTYPERYDQIEIYMEMALI